MRVPGCSGNSIKDRLQRTTEVGAICIIVKHFQIDIECISIFKECVKRFRADEAVSDQHIF